MVIKLLLPLIFLYPSFSLFSITLKNPFLLTITSLKITAIDQDINNSVLIGFQSGHARRYSPDFTSFTDLNLPEPVDQFSFWNVQLNNIELSNGTVWSMSGSISSTLSNNFTILRVYSQPSFQALENYSFSDLVLDYRGFPIICASAVTPLHIFVFAKSIQILYKGITKTAINFTKIFNSSDSVSAVCFSLSIVSANRDYINMTYSYFIAISFRGILQTNITLTLLYNFTSLSYDLTVGANYALVKSFGLVASSLMMANRVLLIQFAGGQLMLACGSIYGPPYNDPNIKSNPILGFQYFNGDGYYIIYSSGLVKTYFSTNTAKFTSRSSVVSTFPNNTYRYSLGSSVSIFYAPLTPYIYKMGCSGQLNWSQLSSFCSSYSCTVPNCNNCQLTSDTCGTCANGHLRNDSFICSMVYTNNTNNATNNTVDPSPSNLNSKISSFLQLPIFQNGVSLAINATQNLISVPGARQLLPIFYFFGNFDDIYLYMFHDRVYGPTFNDLFDQINIVENDKWNVLNYSIDFNLLESLNESVYFQVNYQEEYLTYAYVTNRTSEGPEGLITNCQNFIIIGIPVIVIGFLLARCIFSALSRFAISVLLRKFDFWYYLMIIIFEGNVQQFAFYLTSELRNNFYFSFGDQVLKVSIIWIGFVLVVVSFGGYLIGLGTYRKLNRHLIDNNSNNIKGNTFLLLQSGFRNLLLGVLHSSIRELPYMTMLSVLVSTEILFLLIFTVSIGKKAYKMVLPIWIYLVLTFMRILLISTLFLDYNNVGYDLTQDIQSNLLILMIIVYLIGTIIIIISSIIEFAKDIVKICKQTSSKRKPHQNLRIKVNQAVEVMVQLAPFREEQSDFAFKDMENINSRSIRKTKIKGVLKVKNLFMRIVQVQVGPDQLSNPKDSYLQVK